MKTKKPLIARVLTLKTAKGVVAIVGREREKNLIREKNQTKEKYQMKKSNKE